MKVTIELIDELRSRVNVSYEEAKSVLERNDGDLIKSIIELENKKGIKSKNVKQHNTDFSEFANKVFRFRFSVKNRDGEVIINIPLILVAVTLIMAFWVVIFGVIIAVLTSCNMKIYKAKSYHGYDNIKKDVKHTVNKVKDSADKIFDNDETINKNKSDNKNKADDNDDDNEIIIE
ncbi:DUF4342 domain-containing protein [Sedimentibacter sp. zth1]|uniref:DUF4342 domain-containing protein n=1 Tax=Sedimentibacter sp. zth1 TaxID=2816908 RepID=UPI001A91E8B9|nr:DUF4342 domain-containing protein [Sedimentibacter sp. zth1]QSX06381.1 DUF4342 domain-containing protein [Sedimentibacter sp. zth1]